MSKSVFILEIDGRAVLGVNAADEAEARVLLDNNVTRAELKMLADGQGPVWDGNAQFIVRPADASEAVRWGRARMAALRTGDVEDNEEPFLSLLVLVQGDDEHDNSPTYH